MGFKFDCVTLQDMATVEHISVAYFPIHALSLGVLAFQWFAYNSYVAYELQACTQLILLYIHTWCILTAGNNA